MVKNPPANARDAGDIGSIPGSLIPGLGRSPGEWNSNLLQYSCLVNSVDSGACWVAVLWVAKESDTTEHLSAPDKNTGVGCCSILQEKEMATHSSILA